MFYTVSIVISVGRSVMTANRAIVHIEIPAKDRAANAQFYADLFGWKLTHMTEPAPYTMGEAGNVGIGMPDMDEMYKAGDVIIYIASDDLDADLKSIEKAGGKTLMPKTDIPGMGAFAMFADPSGNRLALWMAAPR
jgi:hypothetical protein